MKNIVFILLGSLLVFSAGGQEMPISVSEQTMKISKEKELYFSFAAGDEIVFDLEVVRGKNIKEVEIVEYPDNSRFQDFKAKNINNKRVKVHKTGIYLFRIKGGGLFPKICKTKISRCPVSSDTRNFNTAVTWETRYDSTYTEKYKKELVSIDTSYIHLEDRVERVHSRGHLTESNTRTVYVNLPGHRKDKLQEAEVVSWAYWVGVGEEGNMTFRREAKNFLTGSVSKYVGATSPMAGLAIGAAGIFFIDPGKGDNVGFRITSNYIPIANGNSVVASGRETRHNRGQVAIALENDNLLKSIDVTVKVTAAVVTKNFVMRPYQELKVEERKFPVLQTK